MTKKEFKKTDSKGREEIWEWDETPADRDWETHKMPS